MRKVFVLIGVIALSSAIIAEERRSEIPPLRPDLVERLLSGHFGDAELHVNELPEYLAALVPLPPAAKMDLSVRRHGSDLILLTMPGNRQSAEEVLETELKKAGWKDAPDPQMVRGGFAHAGMIASAGMCRDNWHLTMGFDLPEGGGVPVSIHLRESPGIVCGEPERRPLRADQIDLPYLYPPSGARTGGSSMGGGGDHARSSIELRTAAPIPELIQHYDGQMIEQGWSRTDQTGSAGAALNRYERTDDEERTWIATLSGVNAGGESRHMSVIVLLQQD